MGSSVKSWVSAPFDAVKSAAKGDIGGVLDAAARTASGGTLGKKKGSILNADDLTGVTAANAAKDAANAQTAQANALIEEQKNAEANAQAKATAARRSVHANDSKTIYTTALGDIAESASGNRRKRTLLGG